VGCGILKIITVNQAALSAERSEKDHYACSIPSALFRDHHTEADNASNVLDLLTTHA
ncbi:hypothetical protein KI387_014919, partial [Taxus chinensis]